MISVILLSFNKSTFLAEAIESVLSQDCDDWELIISDDCSTDDSWDVCLRYASQDPRVRAFQSPSNLGIPKNRAFAFRHSLGDLVCHLDCDDMLYPWSLGVMKGAFDAYPDLAFAYSDFALIGPDSKIIQYGVNPDYYGDLSRFGWRHFGMFRRQSAVDVGGYNLSLVRPCEDGDLVMKMAEEDMMIGRVPYVLYQHRYLGDNASALAGKCGECSEKPYCNYYRIWSKHALNI